VRRSDGPRGTLETATRNRPAVVVTLVAAVACASLAHAGLDEAMSDFKAGKYVEAAAGFQALVDRAPAYDYGHFMLGLSYFKLGRSDEAVDHIERAIELDRGEFNYYHALAGVERARNESGAALAALGHAEALLHGPDEFAFYSLRGFVHADLEKWAEAIDDLERARAERPSAAVLEYLGKAYAELGYPDRAAPVLREAATLNPNDADTQAYLAAALIDLARETEDAARKKTLFSEAVQVATRYRNMRPEGFYGWNLVGKATLGAGAYEEAAQAFVKVLALRADYCYAMVNLARTRIAQSEWAEAESVSRDAIECAPRLTAGYESLGFALHKQRRLPEARAAYQQAHSIKPSPAVEKLIEIVDESIRILEANAAAVDRDAAQAKAEQERIAAEEARAKEWDKRHDD